MGILLSPGLRAPRSSRTASCPQHTAKTGRPLNPSGFWSSLPSNRAWRAVPSIYLTQASIFPCTPMCVPRPHPVGDSRGAIIGTLSKEVGLLCQLKLSSSSQILPGSWRNDMLPPCLTAKDPYKSIGRRILKHMRLKKPDTFLCMSFPTGSGGKVGGGER